MKGLVISMKEKYITLTGMKYYYGFTPFKIGKKIKCQKDKNNPYDSDAIRVKIKGIGTVAYVSNSPYTTATGTYSASRIYSKVKKNFVAEVMFITNSKVICKIIDGFKEKKVSDINCSEVDIESFNHIETDKIE